MKYGLSDSIKEFIGLDINSCVSIANRVRFEDGNQVNIEKQVDIIIGESCGAKPLAIDDNGNGVVYLNTYGKGKVYFII